jgi:peptidoglycan DL-endopeptidase CwlO
VSARSGGKAALTAAAIGVCLGVTHAGGHHHGGLLSLLSAGATPAPSGAARAAVRWAERQEGTPYVWGGTGPGGFDCSGLVMEAYASAGVTIPRTSQEQWAQGPQVPAPARGDLVFFAGADGTPTSPGHVGIVVSPAAHTMVEAYAAGFPVRLSTYGLQSSAPGDQVVVGYTDPGGQP